MSLIESCALPAPMTWAQMANFAIAIGMLLAGAKMAQQLGAAGGSMMGKAGEFGKKVAMTASGLTAARWAGKQALAGAKGAGKLGLKGVDFGLSKVGLSTEDWKRRGRNIKSSVLASYYDKQALKTRKASEIAKALAVDEKGEYVNKGVGGWAKRMLARGRLQFGGYGSFNEEYSGDLEANVKNRQELIEHLASISSTKVGQEKQRSAEELKFNKETGAGIKAGKEAVMDERRLKINQIIAKGGDVDAALAGMGLDSGEIAQVRADYGRLGKANVGKAAAKITGEYTGAAQGKREAEAMEKYMAGEGMKQEEKTSELKAQTQQIQSQLAAEREQEELRAIYNLIKDQGLGEARQKKLTAKKAELESTKEMMDLQKNKAVLLARATEYRDANRPGGPDLLKATLAEQQAHSLELNKLKEVYKTAEIGANERGNIAAQLVQQMEEVRNSALSGPEKEKALKSLVKQKDSLHDFSSTQSSYDAIREEEEELRQLKWDEPINNENVGRRFLSRRLGKKVNAGQEKEALNEYRNLVGDDEYKVRMRQLGAHAKIQQSQGNAGAFVYKESPNRVNGQLTGLTDYEPVVRTGAEIIGDMSGWLKNNYIDTKKILQATGTRRLGEAPGSGSVLININDAEAKFNAEALGTFTSQSIASMGKRGFIGDLNGSAIDKASLTKQLSAFVAKATDKRAFGALTNNLKDVLEKLKIEQKELDELWSSSGKPDVNPQGKGK